MSHLYRVLLLLNLLIFSNVNAESLPLRNFVTFDNLPKHNTIILYSGHNTVPAQMRIREGLLARLTTSKPENEHIEIYEEYMDDIRLKIDKNFDKPFINLWHKKYANIKIDMIVSVGPAADNLLKRNPELFAGTPYYTVGFSGLTQNDGVIGQNIFKMINVIPQTLPETERLIVVMAEKNSGYHQHLKERILVVQPQLPSKVSLEFWDTFSFDELYERAKQLPPKTAIIYYPVATDRLGERKLPFEVIKKLAQVSSAPIFVHDDTYLGLGVVGGYIRNIKQEGDIIGRLILGLNVPTTSDEYDAEVRGYFFDYNQLKRWHISENDLPLNSTIINRPKSFIYAYRWYLLMVIAILAEAVLIMMLIRSIRNSRKLTLELAQERHLLEVRVKERTCELEEARMLFQDAVSVAKLGVFNYDLTTSELRWDDSMFAIYGIDPKIRRLVYDVWQHAVLPEDLPKAEHELQVAISEHKAFDTRFRIRRPDGKIRTVHALAQFYYDENEQPLRLIGINQDVTEQEEAEAIIRNLAYHDHLTQLPNRRLLAERLKQLISGCQRENKKFAVMMMDLDKFKAVNDTLGHAAGDELLIQVAQRIKARLREHDTVARLGGDEFVILLADVHSPKDVARVANALIETLTTPFVLTQSENVQIGTSIGIAFYPQHGEDGDELIDKADIALYIAKENGRGCFAYYQEQEELSDIILP